MLMLCPSLPLFLSLCLMVMGWWQWCHKSNGVGFVVVNRADVRGVQEQTWNVVKAFYAIALLHQHPTFNIQQATDKQMGWSFVKSFDCTRWELKIPAEYFLYFNTLSHSPTGRLIVDGWPLRTYKRIRTKIDGSTYI